MNVLKHAFHPPQEALKGLLGELGRKRLDREAFLAMLEAAADDPAAALVIMGALRPHLPPDDIVVWGRLKDFVTLAAARVQAAKEKELEAAAWARAAVLTRLPVGEELLRRACPHRARAYLALRCGRTRRAAWEAARAVGRAGDLELALRGATPGQVAAWLDEARRLRLEPWQTAPEPVATALYQAATAAGRLLRKDPGWVARQLLEPSAPRFPRRGPDGNWTFGPPPSSPLARALAEALAAARA